MLEANSTVLYTIPIASGEGYQNLSHIEGKVGIVRVTPTEISVMALDE